MAGSKTLDQVWTRATRGMRGELSLSTRKLSFLMARRWPQCYGSQYYGSQCYYRQYLYRPLSSHNSFSLVRPFPLQNSTVAVNYPQQIEASFTWVCWPELIFFSTLLLQQFGGAPETIDLGHVGDQANKKIPNSYSKHFAWNSPSSAQLIIYHNFQVFFSPTQLAWRQQEAVDSCLCGKAPIWTKNQNLLLGILLGTLRALHSSLATKISGFFRKKICMLA